MTIQEYNEHAGISASAIKAGRASMMQMHYAMTTPRDTDAPTPAMRWGTLDDRRDPQLSRAMAWTILEHHYRRGNTDAVALACRWRNPYSRCPGWYAAKVRRALGR